MRDTQGEDRPSSCLRNSILSESNELLGFIVRDSTMAGVRVGFPKGETATHLNQLIYNTRFRGMLESEDNQGVCSQIY